PLTYRDKGTSGTIFDVITGKLRIATIRKDVRSVGPEIYWSFNFALGNAVPTGFEHNGHCESLDDAKAAVEANWQCWLEASGLSD
ncbi:hypothetical protein, partial [Salmonella sp. SAL4449]|uniref:hypothetical protein n=1 Tax=Salmonella sp. SAL4449 TaxID=3159904 RepID=UPI00397BEAD7